MHFTLKLLNGEVTVASVQQDVVTFGRSPKCTIQIPEDGMSRMHCQVELINGELFVTDLNSTNGVFIDGEKIPPNQKVPFQTFLPLAFGAVVNLQISIEDKRPKEPIAPKVPVPRPPPKKTENLTQTRVIKTTRPQAKNSKKEKDEKIQSFMMNLMALAIIVAAIWWYSAHEVEEVNYDNIRAEEER